METKQHLQVFQMWKTEEGILIYGLKRVGCEKSCTKEMTY